MNASASLHEYVLERRGCPLHYWVAGPTDAPSIIFSHGATVDHRMFYDQLEVLVDHWRVLLWDMRGHGKSRPMGTEFTVPEAVVDLMAIMDQAGIQSAVLAGQSTGTYVSQEMLFHHPGRVKALIVIDGSCITMPLSGVDRFLLGLTPAIMKLYPFETLKKQTAEACAYDPEVQRYVAETMGSIGKDDAIRIMTGVANCIHPEPDYRITKPMLLVHGADDKLGNIAKIGPWWAEREPDCEYHVIPKARHNANQDNPAFFNPLMLKFLERVRL